MPLIGMPPMEDKMRKLLILLGTLLCLSPQVAWAIAEFCVMPATTFNWTDWDTVTSGSITGCATPDSQDHYTFQNGSHGTPTFDLAFVSSGDNGITLQAGSSMHIDQTTNAIQITLQQGTTVETEDDIAFYAYAGSVIDFKPAYFSWGLETATVTNEENDNTTWTVDLIGTCNGAARSVGSSSCTSNEEIFCLHYSNARNNPEDGSTGDIWIQESLTIVPATEARVRFIGDSMEAPWAYETVSVDASPSDYSICIDTRRAYDSSSLDVPYTEREIIYGTTIASAIPAGSTCVESSSSLIAADGDLAGRCIRFCDASDANCDVNPLKLARTKDGETCAGGASSGDAFHLSDLNPLPRDLVASAAFTIDLCVRQGDRYVVEYPVRFTDGTNTADDDGRVVIKSTDVTMENTFFAGPGTVRFDGAAFSSVKRLDIADAGDSGLVLPALLLKNMDTAVISGLTISGGDGATGGARQLYIDSVSTLVHINDAGFRYAGNHFIDTTSNPSGTLVIDDAKFEFITHVGTREIGIIQNDGLSLATLRNILCVDCVKGITGSIAEGDSNNPVRINGMTVWGLAEGGFGYNVTNTGVFMENVLGRGINITRTGPASIAFPYSIIDCDLADITATVSNALNQSDGITIDCIINDVDTSGSGVLRTYGNGIIRNVIVANATTSNACTGGACRVIGHQFDGNPATSGTVEYVTVIWPEGSTTAFMSGVEAFGNSGSETDFEFGSILLSGHNVNDADDGYGIRLVADGVAALDGFGDHGTFCVHDGENPGAGSYTYVDRIGQYPSPTPTLGIAPEFLNAENDNWILRADSELAELGCGAKTGAAAPGLRRIGSDHLYEMIGVDPETVGVVDRPRAF